MISLSEENYLKAIYQEVQLKETASTNSIALRLNTKPASVSEMLHKLSDKKLIKYKPYQGVNLTDKGQRLALTVIRKHRLWEYFLVNNLNFKWDEVHSIAEQLEHIQSDKLIEKLSSYLGNPKFDPHGDPIPDKNGKIHNLNAKPLGDYKKGSKLILCAVSQSEDLFLQYLDSLGLKIGATILLKDFIPFDGSLHILINNKTSAFIGSGIANNLLVSKYE
jgi:DtxR family Mn-dependent transcriptional regulator